MAKKRPSINPKALRRLFRRMRPHIRPYRRTLVAAVFAMIGASAMEIARPWPMKIIFDGLLIPQETPDRVTALAVAVTGGGDWLLALSSLAILLIAVIGGLFAFGQAYLIASVGQRVVAAVRLDLYRHIQLLSHSYHDQASTGDILSRLTGDVRMMRDLLINAAIYFAARFLVIGATIAVMAIMNWRLTLVAIAILPVLILISNSFGRGIKGAARRQRRKEGKIAMVMGETISAISVVKGFAREAYEEARFAKQNNSSAKAGLVATRLEAHMDRLVQVVLAFGTSAVIWFGVVQVRAGALTPGDLLVFAAYLVALYKPVRKLAAMTGRVAKATASGERLLEILDLQPDVREAEDAVDAPRFLGQITFEDVGFAYPGGNPVLSEAYLRIRPGETIALIGESGAGKSTLGRLLLRFYDPVEGSVTIDGVDIRAFSLVSLREQIAVVLQDSVLFATTIRDNIAYGRLDATFEEVRAAAIEAGADDFIEAFPDGYDTLVGERGATLSGGQRQRIAIARAIVRDAAILILDEPLAGLDAATAIGVADALRRAADGRTTIVISHEAALLNMADRIVELRNMKLDEETARPETSRRAVGDAG